MRRPHYLQREIEGRCEQRLGDVFGVIKKTLPSPLTTDDLLVIADQISLDLDVLADLSRIGPDVEGATYFNPPQKPKIKISLKLDAPSYQRRRRMTLAHEIGHVFLHEELFKREETLDLFADLTERGNVYCKQDGLLPGSDWMEWQASYAAGAILVPGAALSECIAECRGRNIGFPVYVGDLEARRLVETVSEHFDVSSDAAEIRLIQQKVIEIDPLVQTLALL